MTDKRTAKNTAFGRTRLPLPLPAKCCRLSKLARHLYACHRRLIEAYRTLGAYYGHRHGARVEKAQ